MKTYDEISRDILERRDKYEEEQKIKKQNITQISTAVVCLVLMTAVSFGIVRKNWLKAHINILLPFQTTDSSPTTDAINATTADKATTFPLTAPTTFIEPQTTTSPTPYKDWESKSMPGKFCTLKVTSSQHLSVIDESDSYGNFKEYVYPFGSREEKATTRSATLLVTDIPLEATAPDGTTHQALVDIYSLEGLSEDLALGVSFPDDDRVYIYINNSFTPETLGEFLKAIDYDNTVTYGSITLFPGNNFPVNDQNKADIKTYLLSDMSLANIMSADAEAAGQCVALSINCHELGRQSKSLRIYEDGHIATDLIGYEYTFYVGTEAVTNFLKNSYNITFEEIKAHASVMVTEPTTAATTEPATDSSAEPTSSSDAVPANVTDTTAPTSAADSPAAEEPTAYQITDADTVAAADKEEPLWWCGTETE